MAVGNEGTAPDTIAGALSSPQRRALLGAELDSDGVLALNVWGHVTVGTVVALIDRGLVLDLGRGARSTHHLTDLGRAVRDVLLREDADAVDRRDYDGTDPDRMVEVHGTLNPTECEDHQVPADVADGAR